MLRTQLLNLVIIGIWIFLCVDAYQQGRDLPEFLQRVALPDFPLLVFTGLAIVVCIATAWITFWQRKKIMEDFPLITRWTDRLLGDGAYRTFTNKMRPIVISIVTSVLLGIACLYSTHQTTQNPWAYGIGCSALLLALTLVVALLASHRFPPVLK